MEQKPCIVSSQIREFFGLRHENAVELVGSTLYRPFDLDTRVHDALCHLTLWSQSKKIPVIL